MLPFFLTLPSGSRLFVCVSFKNLFIHFVVRFMFREVSQTSLGLEKAGLDSGFSPAACLPGRGGGWRPVWVVVVCVVLGSVDPLFSGGAGRPFVWPGETWQGQSSESRSLFNLCLHLVTYSFHCFLGVGNIYGRATQCMPGTASGKRRRNSSAECRAE